MYVSLTYEIAFVQFFMTNSFSNCSIYACTDRMFAVNLNNYETKMLIKTLFYLLQRYISVLSVVFKRAQFNGTENVYWLCATKYSGFSCSKCCK